MVIFSIFHMVYNQNIACAQAWVFFKEYSTQITEKLQIN